MKAQYDYLILSYEAGTFYKEGSIRAEEAQEALNVYLRANEIELSDSFYVVKESDLQGPFIIKLNPTAVRPEEMVGVNK